MGDPKKKRRKFKTPKDPFIGEKLHAELELIGEYGLRNKRELWSHYTQLSKYRTMARRLLAKTRKERAKIEGQILAKLYSLGVISENATLDDVHDLSIKDILARRLQTVTVEIGLAKTPQQARQLIVHGHISIGGRRVRVPSYLVSRKEETTITHSFSSPLSGKDHPLRKELLAITAHNESADQTLKRG
ncbi:MAG: 30S ribosomal protein S4 [Candidatus Bathyarchaeota archaeon]|nr:30S ribosomal protein S4 [Candidatus Bathyarchaeota archaeon]